jgi:transcriptional regulator with XRE-family HTH domain
MTTDTFADRLRARREAAGLTQRQLAELAGVPQTTIASLEAGAARSPRADVLASLADALGLDMAELYPARPVTPVADPAGVIARLEGRDDLTPGELRELAAARRAVEPARERLRGRGWAVEVSRHPDGRWSAAAWHAGTDYEGERCLYAGESEADCRRAAAEFLAGPA